VTVSTVSSAARLGDKHAVATFRAPGYGGDGCNQACTGWRRWTSWFSGGNR